MRPEAFAERFGPCAIIAGASNEGLGKAIARGEVMPSARPDSTLRALVGACCAYEPAERISAARLAEELVKMLAASKLAPHQ